MEYHLVTFSDGQTVLTSSTPHLQLSAAPDGVKEISRQKLSNMTQEKFEALMIKSADHRLRYDENTRSVIATPKQAKG